MTVDSSNPTTNNATYDQPNHASDFDRSVAVIVGINAYQNGIPPLKTPINDARQLATILKHNHAYEVLQTTFENATLAQLTLLLDETLPDEVGPDDRLIVYFAGHGLAAEGDDGPEGFLIPQDGTQLDRSSYLSMNRFHDALMALGCRHVLIILDCCFAGTIRWSTTRHAGAIHDEIHWERYQRFVQYKACQVITSTAYDQKALDVPGGDIRGTRTQAFDRSHSPFAQSLFAALRGGADLVPKGGDGLITAHELITFLQEQFLPESLDQHLQTPALWPLKAHDRGEFVFHVPNRQLTLPSAPQLRPQDNPYRGLNAFEEDHAPLFFGRQNLIQESLAPQVIREPVTIVVGASGTGKSSLVKAGLLPYLRGIAHIEPDTPPTPNGRDWFLLPPIRPTNTPMAEIERLLRSHFSPLSPQTNEAAPHHSPNRLLKRLSEWGRLNPAQTILLVIDQCEELVTLCQESQKQRFLLFLKRCLDVLPDQLHIVITLRSDFEPQFADTFLDSYRQRSRFIVPQMGPAELREAIEGPASARVLYFEPPSLVDDLIQEVIQTPNALPLLSFTLSELYVKYIERQDGNRALTADDYRSLGGVIGSLRHRATEEYNRVAVALSPRHQETMKRILLRMVSTDANELARRRVPKSELDYADEDENRRVEAVLERLINSRLLVSDQEMEDLPAYYEPAHDAMVQAWDKLLLWSREAEEYLPLQRRLNQAAVDWARGSDEAQKDLLWHENPRLAQVEYIVRGRPASAGQRWLGRQFNRFLDLWRQRELEVGDDHWLNRVELAFVQESVRRQRIDSRNLFAWVVGVIVALGFLTSFAFYQLDQTNQANNAQATEVVQRQTAEAQAIREADARATEVVQRQAAEVQAVDAAATAVYERNIALSRELASQSAIELDRENDTLALLLAIEAGRNGDTIQAANALHQVLADPVRILTAHTAHKNITHRIAWSADSRRLLSVGSESDAQIWNADTGIVQSTLESSSGFGYAVWNKDESRVLTSDFGGQVYLWDAASGILLRTFGDHTSTLITAFWSPAEDRILSYGYGAVKLWDADARQELWSLTPKVGLTRHAEWSEDGRQLLIATENMVEIWDTSTGTLLKQLPHKETVWKATWNADHRYILTISGRYTATLWDTAIAEPVAAYPTDQATWHSQDGHLWVAMDGVITILDVDQPIEPVRTIPFSDPFQDVAWSHDGRRFLTTEETAVTIWDVDTGSQLASYADRDIYQAKWSPDDSRVAISFKENGRIHIWDVRAGQELNRYPGSIRARSHDFGRILTYSSDVGLAQIWDSASQREVARFRPVNHPAQITWSPDDTLIVTRYRDDDGPILQLWDAGTGDETHRLSFVNTVRFVYWNATSDKLVVADNGGVAHVIDIATGNELLTLSHPDDLKQAFWNRDGTRMITITGNDVAGQDDIGTVRIWDTRTGALLVALEHALLGENIYQAHWNTNETQLLTAGNFEDPQLWDAVTGEHLLTFESDDLILSAQWNRDESRILTVGLTGATGTIGTAHVWDSRTGGRLFSLNEHAATIGASWSPDEQFIITYGRDNLAIIWDAENGAELARLPHLGPVFAAAWNESGTMVATTTQNGPTRVWDAQTGVERFVLPIDGATELVWLPDGDHLWTHSRRSVGVWQLDMEALLTTACALAPRNLTRQEWTQFIDFETYRATCDTVPPGG